MSNQCKFVVFFTKEPGEKPFEIIGDYEWEVSNGFLQITSERDDERGYFFNVDDVVRFEIII